MKIGDVVKIKGGLEIQGPDPSGKIGRIIDILTIPKEEGETHDEKMIVINFDSQTLQDMSDEMLKELWKEEWGIYEVKLKEMDVELHEPRDTFEEMEETIEKVIKKQYDLVGFEVSPEEKGDTEYFKWMRYFHRSRFFTELTLKQKQDTYFAMNVFQDYMFNSYGEEPKEWTTYSLQELCTNQIPCKVSMPTEFFKDFAIILKAFLQFLPTKNFLDTQELQKALDEVADQIPKIAADPRNWGFAKQFGMSMLEANIDIEDQEAVDQYMLKYNAEKIAQLSPPEPQLPFIKTAKYRRNDPVTVKYQDGTIKKTKYKKVKKDLDEGLCEIVEN